jgi:hypothetical protein
MLLSGSENAGSEAKRPVYLIHSFYVHCHSFTTRRRPRSHKHRPILLLVGLGSQCNQTKVEITVGLVDVLFLNDSSDILR